MLYTNNDLIRNILYAQWVNIKHFLLVIISLALSVLWDQVPYSGFGMMSRVVLTICISRSIRTICFMVTILPSPKKNCYMRRFPAVPDNWIEFIKVGFKEMRGHGGCNDLIFSGHCGIWVLAPLAFHSYYKNQCCMLLWIAVIQTSIRAVLEHHHYSIDMVLAIIITTFIWKELDMICPSSIICSFTYNSEKQHNKLFLIMIIMVLLFFVAILVLASGS